MTSRPEPPKTASNPQRPWRRADAPPPAETPKGTPLADIVETGSGHPGGDPDARPGARKP